jgi:hypothetical protein
MPVRRLAAQQAVANQQTEAAAQFDAVYSLIFRDGYRPAPPRVEISAITSQGQRLALLPKAVPANSGVVAFVQNKASGEVLQAIMLPACPG